MWNNLKKAVTFSYDDGVESDKKLIAILNKYGFRATFNLNSGLIGTPDYWTCKSFDVRRLSREDVLSLYRGHEVAVHGTLHLHANELGDAALDEEFGGDKMALESLFGVTMRGMAYPYGDCDAPVAASVARAGLRYGRTVFSSHGFALPEDPILLKPTCHHDDPEVFELIDRFLASESNEPQLLYIWGHAYEFDANDNWDRLEEICRRLSGHPDIFIGTNAEVLLGEVQ